MHALHASVGAPHLLLENAFDIPFYTALYRNT